MKKLTELERVRMNEDNSLFGNADLTDIEKILTYMEEIVGVDIIPREMSEIRDGITADVKAVKEGLSNLKGQLQDLMSGDHLPGEEDTGGALPDPEDILALFPAEK